MMLLCFVAILAYVAGVGTIVLWALWPRGNEDKEASARQTPSEMASLLQRHAEATKPIEVAMVPQSEFAQAVARNRTLERANAVLRMAVESVIEAVSEREDMAEVEALCRCSLDLAAEIEHG